MATQFKSFEDLTWNASSFLIRRLNKTQGTAHHYHCLWRKIKSYMDAKNITQFDAAVGKRFLLETFENKDYAKLGKSEKDLVRAVTILRQFCSTGSIEPLKMQPTFEGPIGLAMVDYLAYRTALRLNRHTIEQNERHLHHFLCYLNTDNIKSPKLITQLHVLKFSKTLDPKYATSIHLILQSLRGFFRYCYHQNLLDFDLATIVPKDNFVKQPKLPSVYSPNEIKQIIASVDRGNATGKRNYAVLMLAVRLGLRASDIANLKFENIHWQNSKITINQYKTGKHLELPLLPEVGNGLVDYLKYGRPKSDERFVFLIAQSPYLPINRTSITGIVHKFFVKSGVNITQRKHGAHALRHSLAGVLLENETILPVISEVLGHQNTASTSYYLRVDLKSMKKCILEVPPVAGQFYQQKGGYFYA